MHDDAGRHVEGAYFLAADLPADPAARDDLLLRIMGSPDSRQIDGIGGAHPLTSKVAVVSDSARPDADIDYLFLQVGVGEATVSDRQNCGNLLAGVGPFAVERGLVRGSPVRIHMVNSGSLATATFPGTNGAVSYDGDTAIAGVPGTAAAVVLDFAGTAGSATGALLPSGHVTDVIEVPPPGDEPKGTPRYITVTCLDNGMPVVVVPAAELGRTGYETVAELEADSGLGRQVRALLPPEDCVMSPQDRVGTAATRPPLHEVAHLGHIELLTPKLCASLWFFVDVLGMTEAGREGSRAGTGSSCATRSPGWCWPRTGARSPGRRPNGPKARRGA